MNDAGVPPLDRFVAMLDRATAVPMLSTWGAELWRHGVKAQLIEPLSDTRGVEGWHVSADSELWLALIEKSIQRSEMVAHTVSP